MPSTVCRCSAFFYPRTVNVVLLAACQALYTACTLDNGIRLEGGLATVASRNIDYTHKKVLLIDSSGNLRSTIFYMLRELGVRNVKATTVNEKVLELIREESFDIILLGHNSSDAVT